jgi:type III pantothenate kinase
MNLVIDIGNTTSKLALFKGQEKKEITLYKQLNIEVFQSLFSSNKIDKAIISSVKDIPDFLTAFLKEKTRYLHILSFRSMLPFAIDYETPDTLGTDRIAAAAGAYCSFCGENVLIIDAGTAITFDFLYGNRYKGGNISPGIDMRFKALNKFTERLPLVEKSSDFSFPGRNTTEAILAGVIEGVTYEINEYIRTFKKEHKNNKVIITGGDCGFLKEKLSHKAHYFPDIVIYGLNYILRYNAK